MKKFLFLLLVSFILIAEEHGLWTFSYLNPNYASYPSRLITKYPEFRELLEQIHGLINDEKFDSVSLLLRDKISSYCIKTRQRDEFEKLIFLIHIDAALDYFLRNNSQQGLNKQYIVFYLSSRLFNRQRIGGAILHNGYTSNFIRDSPYCFRWNFSPLRPYFFSLTILKNSNYPKSSWSRFIHLVENLPFFHFFHFYELSEYGAFVRSFNSYYSFNPDNFANDFDLFDFIVSFEGFENDPPDIMLIEREDGMELDDIIALYWHEDDETRWFYNPEWDINTTLNLFSQDLFYMRDFSEDIKIFSNPIFLEGARIAANAVDARIQITEFPIASTTERTGPTHEMFVFVTFRQARAEAFFRQYYGNEL
jgi:hypothetical protein